jgi:hypothetical protein
MRHDRDCTLIIPSEVYNLAQKEIAMGALVFIILFILLIGLQIATGSLLHPRSHITRQNHPVTFWLIIALELMVLIMIPVGNWLSK